VLQKRLFVLVTRPPRRAGRMSLTMYFFISESTDAWTALIHLSFEHGSRLGFLVAGGGERFNDRG